jgi:hypothetical protein
MELHNEIDQLQTDRTKFRTSDPSEHLPERGFFRMVSLHCSLQMEVLHLACRKHPCRLTHQHQRVSFTLTQVTATSWWI